MLTTYRIYSVSCTANWQDGAALYFTSLSWLSQEGQRPAKKRIAKKRPTKEQQKYKRTSLPRIPLLFPHHTTFTLTSLTSDTFLSMSSILSLAPNMFLFNKSSSVNVPPPAGSQPLRGLNLFGVSTAPTTTRFRHSRQPTSPSLTSRVSK